MFIRDYKSFFAWMIISQKIILMFMLDVCNKMPDVMTPE